MLKTAYSGPISLLGSGVYTSGWMARRSVIEVGGVKVRRVFVSDYMDTMLETSAEEGQEVRVNFGWTLFCRWVLSIKDAQETHREGFFLFLAGMLTQLVIPGFLALVVGAIVENYTNDILAMLVFLALGGYVLATLVLNVKAWLGK